RVTGARVLLLGVPQGLVSTKTAEKAADSAPSISDAPKLTLQTPVDQHRIFARTLLELLTNSRLRLESVAADSGPLPAKINEKLASYDSIVLVGDAPGLDMAAVKRGGIALIDARDHSFVPGSAQRTAWHSNPAGVAAVYTGVVPIVYKAQRMLL